MYVPPFDHHIFLTNLETVILARQTPTGAFTGDRFGEIDARFAYCAVNALSLLGRLHLLDSDLTVAYIRKCRNFDGGFGSCADAESHAAMVLCCVSTLAILDRIQEEVDVPKLAWWLAERQLPNGGLNGRPEKLEDVRFFSDFLSLGEWIVDDDTFYFFTRYAIASGSSHPSPRSANSRGSMPIS